MSEDEWVKVATNDDTLVVELLLKLNQADPPFLPPPSNKSTASTPSLRLDWSVRQRRSKQVTRKTTADQTRASPTTPLSWSGATSVSGGAPDGFEESSLPAKAIDTSRSKVAGSSSATPSTKRSRRKKTLAELKDEESILLKEKRVLKNQLAALQFSVEKQRATNERLKRLKLDLLSSQTPETVKSSIKSEEVDFNLVQQIKVTRDPICSSLAESGACYKSEPSLANASLQMQEVGNSNNDPSILLPDLNQLPIEVDSESDVLYGLS